MGQVRVQVLCGPASVHPRRMGRPAVVAGGEWYAWRLIGTNNHELGRSARSFPSYRLALDAFGELRAAGAGRLVPLPVREQPTGRWGWRLELDGAAVAISGRWYQRDHEGLLAALRFAELTAEAAPAGNVVALHDRLPR